MHLFWYSALASEFLGMSLVPIAVYDGNVLLNSILSA